MNWAQVLVEGSERAVFSVDGQAFVFDASMVELLASGVAQGVRDAASAVAAGGRVRGVLTEDELCVPVRPGKIPCVGLNYRDHAAEVGMDLPEFPAIFAKYPNVLVEPGEPIELPEPEQSTRIDWEVELAVVMGRSVRRASEVEAAEAIFGFTVANDISVRDWQGRTSEWFQGKNWDRSNPLGPVIVPASELDIEAGLRMRCLVDGEVRQDGSTRDLVFGPAQVVSYLSQLMTLEPGDVILTGTPAGVGLSRRPRCWLTAGQTVVTEIEGIGRLVNTCVLP